MKWIKRIVILLIVVIIAAGVAVYVMIDQLAKQGIERGGTYALGVETKVDSVLLGLGTLHMNDLSVANPEGFKAEHFLKLGEGDVDVTLGSLMSEKVEVPSLKFSDIELVLEKDKGRANYDVILENLGKLSGPEREPAEDAKAKKYVVNEIVIKNVKVKAQVIGGMSVPVVIPEIILTDVGSDTDKGVLLKDLSGIVVAAILKSVAELPVNVLPGDIGEGLRSGLGAIGDLGDFGVQIIGDVTTEAGTIVGETTKQVGEAVEGVGEAAKDVGEEATKAVDKIGEGIGGLLGGKKKEESQAEPEPEPEEKE